MSAGKAETQLRKIDSETAVCGHNGVDIREITILELQKAFSSKLISSKELVQCYLKRIELMNPFLNAVLETNPHAVEIAEKLDEERDQGINHGLLHGIPILLKDTMATGDGMENTAGSTALLGLKPKQDCEVAKKLRKAGAIILGKANLSEFGNFRATNMPNGWSGRGKRTKNVFVQSADSSGSSSGSAVAVSANLVTVALGGETDGSIICPAAAASLVGLKPTLGRVSTVGTIGISQSQDVIGPVARTAADAAIVFDAISDHTMAKTCFNPEFGLVDCDAKAIKIGVLRDPDWAKAEPEQLPKLEEILAKLGQLGFNVIDPVAAAPGSVHGYSFDSEMVVYCHEFKVGLNHYLKHEVHQPEPCLPRPDKIQIQSLADVIAFNIQNPPEEGYNQEHLQGAEATNGLQSPAYIANKLKNKGAAQFYINFIMTQYSLDAIVIPSISSSCDHNSCGFPAVAGYPHVTVPAGFTQNGLPFGISFYGMPNSEETLLAIAHKLEKVHKARRTPTFQD